LGANVVLPRNHLKAKRQNKITVQTVPTFKPRPGRLRMAPLKFVPLKPMSKAVRLSL
jgi:hypothetical protein